MEDEYVEFYIFARDEDNALEMAGNSADYEYQTLDEAISARDPDFHDGKKIYRILVEEAKLPKEAPSADNC